MLRRVVGVFLLIIYCFLLTTNCVQAINILSCDGGGVRGVITIEMLINLQEETGLNPNRDFEVYAGTSIGSIIVVLLALGMEPKAILRAYGELSSNVFSNSRAPYLFLPKYNNDPLRTGLMQLLKPLGCDETTRLCDLPKKVIIPIVSLCDSEKGRCALEARENFTEEGGQIKVIDALLESTAAPTYFPSYHCCVDGGIGAQDPSLAAISYTCGLGKVSLKDMVVLAIGTGYNKKGIKGDANWGQAQWQSKILSMFKEVSDQIPAKLNGLLLGDSFMKIDFVLPQSIPLDDYQQIDSLIQITDTFIEENSSTWVNWCNWVKNHIHPSHLNMKN